MKLFSIFLFFIALFIGILFVSQQKQNYQVLRGYVFGTYYVIKVRTDAPIKDFASLVDTQFDKVNAHLSVFEPKSEVNLFNQSASFKNIQVSADLYQILETSQKIYIQSGGFFDPTVGPLIELWGFGVNKEHKVPAEDSIKKVLSSVGFNKIVLLPHSYVMKKNANLNLNLSAIAKGYAVDLVAKALHERGYQNFLIDIGGEIYAAGSRNIKEQGWNIGIAAPSESDYRNSFAVTISNMAVATSGNYRNFYYINGQKFAHTINPKTGAPVKHHLLSVSVFAPNCMLADAYATAIMAMGEKTGLDFAEKLQLPVILFVGGDVQNAEIVYSSAAKLLLENQK